MVTSRYQGSLLLLLVIIQAFGCGDKQALSPTAASAGGESCSAAINLYSIPDCMSFAVTIIPTLGTSPTPWLADALNTSKVDLMCVYGLPFRHACLTVAVGVALLLCVG